VRRRRREWGIAAAVALLLALGFVFESVVIARARSLPIGSEAVFFALVHFNVVGIGVLGFFLARNVIKLVTDRRRGIVGSKLNTKFVVSFVFTAALSTTGLFILSAFLVTHTLQTWFELQLSDGLRDSLAIADIYYAEAQGSALGFAQRIASQIEERKLLREDALVELREFVSEKRGEYGLGLVEIVSAGHERLAIDAGADEGFLSFAEPDADLIRSGLGGESGVSGAEISGGELLRAVAPVRSSFQPYGPNQADVVGAVVVNRFVPGSIGARVSRIRSALAAYLRMQPGEGPFEASVLLLLGMLTLVSLLFSSWMGFRLAKQVTDPIQHLALATHQLSAGNLDVRVEQSSEDELGLLVAAFNRMASELKASRTDLEQRRALIEIILGGVGAGVISLDRHGSVTTINPPALRLLGIPQGIGIGRKLGELLHGDALQTLEELLRELAVETRELVRRQVPISVEAEQRIFNWTVSQLRDAGGSRAGVVIVLDDVTQIVKGERMEAWRDVARRIAHEIKNPLTPIQLSAQRLQRKLGGALRDPGAQRVLRECTDAITGQVDAMKLLLSEFSNFARLPATDPVRTDLNGLAQEAVALYKGKASIRLRTELAADLPELDVDREQIKRVLLNLIDNAIHSIDTAEPGPRELCVATRFDQSVGTVQLEVADTGCGIRPSDRARIFQPGFSTKEGGTGIGLAIVSRIVSDHSGTIRVRPNEPRGARFLIELPART
jgi:two-component system nitrogen regulation sensor histidine kinase NtrY